MKFSIVRVHELYAFVAFFLFCFVAKILEENTVTETVEIINAYKMSSVVNPT